MATEPDHPFIERLFKMLHPTPDVCEQCLPKERKADYEVWTTTFDDLVLTADPNDIWGPFTFRQYLCLECVHAPENIPSDQTWVVRETPL